ncbi:MAG: NADH-quinone oxidoreductase subunit N [Myxococcales bacterium]|nr:NADH-quinone oxidoreductase subunit N [Myxococcales bacterium]
MLLLSPILVLAVGGLIVMLIDAFQEQEGGLAMPTALLHFVAAAAALALWQRGVPSDAGSLVHGWLAIDKTTLFLQATIALGGAFASLLAGGYLAEHKLDRGEYYPLIAFSTAGAGLLVAANDMLMVFVALETMSLGVYAMTGFRRTSARSAEAALKYFLLGSFAAALLLMGAALLYTVTGHTDFPGIAAALQAPSPASGAAADDANAAVLAAQFAIKLKISIFAMLLVLVAMAFKVGAVPFHMWTPDAYEGAPTSTTAYMSVVVKAAAFGALLRVFLTVFGDAANASISGGWPAVLSVLAVLTMSVGNLVALTQTSVKRMLAYSSVAHAGYLLLGVVAAPHATAGIAAKSSVLFYLLGYTVSNAGAMGALILAGRRGAETVSYDDLAGYARRHPAAGFALTLFLLSLTGVPPTVGFFGKFYIIRATLDAGYTNLAIIALINSAVSAYYYLGVLVKMYMREPAPGATRAAPMKSFYVVFSLIVAGVLVVWMGLMPERWLSLAAEASGARPAAAAPAEGANNGGAPTPL